MCTVLIIGVFALSWFVFGAILSFQAMLCVVIDTPEDKHPHITMMDIMAPLLVLIGWAFVIIMGMLISFESPFQV